MLVGIKTSSPVSFNNENEIPYYLGHLWSEPITEDKTNINR